MDVKGKMVKRGRQDFASDVPMYPIGAKGAASQRTERRSDRSGLHGIGLLSCLYSKTMLTNRFLVASTG